LLEENHQKEKICENNIQHTDDLSAIGIGRRTNGVNITSNKRHRCSNQLTIRIIITEFDENVFFNQLIYM